MIRQSFFQQLGRQIQWAEERACSEELAAFRVNVFCGWRQRTVDTIVLWLVTTFPFQQWKRRKYEQAKQWLKIIRSYKDRVIEQYNSYAENYMRWEAINRGRCAPGYLLDGEQRAWDEAMRLTAEAEKELRAAGYPYQDLQRRQLVVTRRGWVSVENVPKYWNALETFFATRVRLLDQPD